MWLNCTHSNIAMPLRVVLGKVREKMGLQECLSAVVSFLWCWISTLAWFTVHSSSHPGFTILSVISTLITRSKSWTWPSRSKPDPGQQQWLWPDGAENSRASRNHQPAFPALSNLSRSVHYVAHIAVWLVRTTLHMVGLGWVGGCLRTYTYIPIYLRSYGHTYIDSYILWS